MMRPKVVEDHHVAGSQLGNENLTDIFAIGFGIHGPVERHAGGGPIQSNRGDHRRRIPMAVRGVVVAALAALGPAIQPNHVRFGPGFVNEYKGIDEFPKQLQVLFGPGVPAFLYVWPISFTRV